MHSFIAKLPRKFKILIMLICDVVLLPMALWSAIALRYGTFEPNVMAYWWIFLSLPFFTVPIFIRVGLYRAVIRYLDEQIIKTVFLGVTLSVLVLIAIVLMTQVQGLPRSSVIIYWVLASSYIAFSRYLARGILRTLERNKRRKTRVAIYGAGRAGLQTALALMSGPEHDPVLFFDDHPELRGATVAGIRVYNPQDAELIMEQYSCYQLLLALPSSTRAKRREIIQRFEGKKIQLMTIPGMGEILAGNVRIDDIREVGIEDLLGRDPVPPFEDLMSNCIQDKVVLVTGAGGSIGSELCRQILKYNPKKIILFERSEYSLYKLEQELRSAHKNREIIPVLGDVLNQQIFEILLKASKVDTIYHAAAYKHVPLVESNIVAGVLNNVFGTLSAAKAAINQNVPTFVLISTDKAVRPTNVMGATKRLAELILQAMSAAKVKTRFCMVRFGNVLGSSGSVVPLFREQIKAGGPVTVTHPEVTRYFMTIPEAAQLVLQAGAMGAGGEVFVLDMGEPIKIQDLAKKMIELSGFEVKDTQQGTGDIAIEYVGLRPGEKLYEELLIGNKVDLTKHPRIRKANEDFIELPILMAVLETIHAHCTEGNADSVVACIREVVKEYSPCDHLNS
ncbi:MAG: polysaccharide biosynthesis protein [Bdellovibrio sp.]|nr:polysaccharide biosynthesis protein [Bdellovibrio sp.]